MIGPIRERKVQMGFERNPPRCLNCQHYQPPAEGNGQRGSYQGQRCTLGRFEVSSHSICDKWLGVNGEKLI